MVSFDDRVIDVIELYFDAEALQLRATDTMIVLLDTCSPICTVCRYGFVADFIIYSCRGVSAHVAVWWGAQQAAEVPGKPRHQAGVRDRRGAREGRVLRREDGKGQEE